MILAIQFALSLSPIFQEFDSFLCFVALAIATDSGCHLRGYSFLVVVVDGLIAGHLSAVDCPL